MIEFENVIIDFNCGAQIVVPPKLPDVKYAITNPETGEVHSGTAESNETEWTIYHTKERYFVPWNVELEIAGKKYLHTCNPACQTVIIDMTHGALGDSIAWMPAVEAFQVKYNCKQIYVAMQKQYLPMFDEKKLKNIKLIAPDGLQNIKAQDSYARYILAVWGNPFGNYCERIDFRHNNLQLHADMILGVDSMNRKPHIADGVKPENGIVERLAKNQKGYVCIATRASRKCKEWNNPGAWYNLVHAIQDRLGLDVVCIDADDNNMPLNAINNTGLHPLNERIYTLKHSKFFIGLPSGLSWLAWACDIPVVLISGFSDVVRPDLPTMRYPEFDTPYRVSPPFGVCRNCWAECNQLETKRFDECYRNKGNECTRSITPENVYAECVKVLRNIEK